MRGGSRVNWTVGFLLGPATAYFAYSRSAHVTARRFERDDPLYDNILSAGDDLIDTHLLIPQNHCLALRPTMHRAQAEQGGQLEPELDLKARPSVLRLHS